MPTITQLSPQARHPERVNVFLDGEFAFALAGELAAGLRVGQALDEAALARLQAEEEAHRALDRALGQLERRPRSRAELAHYLGGKGVAPETIERVLARLAELGLVDDAAFAAWWVDNRARHRPRGAQALRQELSAKGIGREEQRAAMADVDEAQLALAVARAQAQRYRGLPRADFERRLGGFLARRGFGYQAVRAALRSTWPLVAGEGGPEDEAHFDDLSEEPPGVF
jgi:regulatory protein